MNKKDIVILGNHDERTIAQMENCVKHEAVIGAALLPDGHLGYGIPIGGVVAYDGHISPTGVGFDISCGCKVVKTDAMVNIDNTPRLMDEIWSKLDFGVGRVNSNDDSPSEHELFDDPLWNEMEFLKPLKQKAQNQLGTIGSGNHYVDLLKDSEGVIHIGVHFGSRGLGHNIATHFLKLGGAKDGIDVDPLVLAVDSPMGEDYLRCMELAGRYAYAGRNWVCDKVLGILGAKNVYEVHNHHNFAWSEKVNGKDAYVVRKGATPAFPGQEGFVGGSMGDVSFILEGKDSEFAERTLHSAVHGAGRVMSRTAAKGKYHRKTGELISAGAVTEEAMAERVARYAIELRGGGLDEAPQCYRDLHSVLTCIEDGVKVTTKLTPIGVAMAGKNEMDPWKD